MNWRAVSDIAHCRADDDDDAMIGNLWNPLVRSLPKNGEIDSEIAIEQFYFWPPHCTNLGTLALIPAMRVGEAFKWQSP
jgi:hypothetical protein